MINTKPIGLIIKDISREKNLNVSKIAKSIGKSRQYVYNSFAKESMELWELKEWATALQMNIEELTIRSQKKDNKAVGLLPDKPSFGSEVLDTLKRLVEVEMQEKNERIRNLEDMLRQSMAMNKELLGKSEGGAYAGLERGDFFYPVLTDMLTPAGIYS
jgi:hypothetical protein